MSGDIGARLEDRGLFAAERQLDPKSVDLTVISDTVNAVREAQQTGGPQHGAPRQAFGLVWCRVHVAV